MKKIIVKSPKYGEKEILVDDSDYEELSKYHWCIAKMPNTFYATRSTSKNGKEGAIYMHRQILELTKRNEFADHIDHNGLNNQRNNLRLSNHSDNQKNKQPLVGSSSKYVGVCWHKKDKKWQAAIAINGKQTHLGQFDNEIDAAIARDNAAKQYYGAFANLNLK